MRKGNAVEFARDVFSISGLASGYLDLESEQEILLFCALGRIFFPNKTQI